MAAAPLLACLLMIADSGSAPTAARSSSPYLGSTHPGQTYVRSRPKPRSVLWAVGDGATTGLAGEPVASLISSRRVDRFLYLGDVYETGTAGEFAANYAPVFGRFDGRAAPTLGNHEWANRATGYDPYWHDAKGRPTPEWYWFAASGWQLISLDSNASLDAGSDQLRWLRHLLDRTPRYGRCRIAFEHHPRYSGGLHGDDAALEPAWEALARRARLLLSGHDHDMQRFEPVDGIVQVVAGSGGRDLYSVDRGTPGLRFADDTQHGALKLVLTPQRAVGRFVAADGTVLDTFSVPCRPL